MTREFVVFLLIGGLAALVNFSGRIVYNQWMGFSAAIVLAYITGMITAFILGKLFVFKQSQQSISRSFFRFTLVNFLAILQTWIVSIFLANYFLPNVGVDVYVNEISHGIGVIVPVFSSYFGHKRWSFA